MRLIISLLVVFVAITSLYSQKQKIDLNETLSIDKDVKIGKFDNGLTYYIRKNSMPEKRVEMRLVVNVGSLYEDDNQQGLAHFVEHMCFNGTKNFPKNELINFLEKMGIKFGGDLNAYTSFAETVYMLFLPTDNNELLDKGFQVLEDWASNVSFDDKEIDKERGVIIEEWRLGLGADDRMRKKSFPVIFKDSRYADRIPIGKKEVLEKFKYETIKSFYKDWYRPNLISVVVVGDIDVNIAEEKIKKHFEHLKNPPTPKARIEYDLPDNIEPLISIETDKEATSNTLMYFIKHPHIVPATIGDFKEKTKAEIYNGMLNDRLRELSQKEECPYIMAYSAYTEFLARSNDAYMSYAMMKENKIKEGFEAILKESYRVKQHGFTETELERQKEKILTDYERAAKEIDKTESRVFAQHYVNNYLSKDPIPGQKAEFELIKQILPSIKLEDINSLAEKWITEKNQVVMITAPEKKDLIVPTKAEILSVMKKVKTLELEPYVDKVSNNPLVENIPQGVKVTNRKQNDEYGFTELTFANGIKAILKPTDFKNDEILVSAYSPGGTSLYPDNDIMSANFASTIINQSGVGKFDNTELEKKLTGKTVTIYPVIDELQEGFKGNCSPKDFETLLQLVYLYFAEPRKDTAAYQAFMSKTKNQIKFFRSSPQIAFSEALVKTISQNNPRVIAIPSDEQLDMVTLDRAYDIYKDRYADASDFTFFFVGSFNVDEIIPLLENYLGALPVKNRKENYKDVSPKFPDGIKEVTVKKGQDPKSMVAIVMSDKFEWNAKERLQLQVATDILNIKLRESLREDQGGVYGVQIMSKVEQFPKPEYQIFVAFGCSPKNAKKLAKTVFAEMEKIIKNGPTEDDLAKVKETLIRERETKLKKNNFWLSTLEDSFYNNDDLSKINKFNDNVNAITITEIQAIAKKYMTKEHYVKVVLMPEKKKK